jgi:ribosomal protein S18 acetylase RimI-like enzyme
MTSHARLFTRSDLPVLLDFVSAVATARAPCPIYLMTSDVAWRLPGSAPKENLRLWFDETGLAGYVWFEPTTGMEFDIRGDLGYRHHVAEEMLAWSESRRHEFPAAFPRFIDLTSMDEWADEINQPRAARADDGLCLTATAFDDDAPRIAFLEGSGFRPTQHVMLDYRRDLTAPIAVNNPPDGMRLRHVGDEDLVERVAVHRASWLRSTWSLETYRKVRSSPVYDAELDIVLEAADGAFASYCICWADPHTRVGSYEPVGTRPQWRGRGVGRAVILEGFRRLGARGMLAARVGTAGFNAPAQALYESCGFVRIGTCRTYLKRLT